MFTSWWQSWQQNQVYERTLNHHKISIYCFSKWPALLLFYFHSHLVYSTENVQYDSIINGLRCYLIFALISVCLYFNSGIMFCELLQRYFSGKKKCICSCHSNKTQGKFHSSFTCRTILPTQGKKWGTAAHFECAF